MIVNRQTGISSYLDLIQDIKHGVLSLEDFLNCYPELNTPAILKFFYGSIESEEEVENDYINIESFFSLSQDYRLRKPKRFFNINILGRDDNEYFQYFNSLYSIWRELIRNYKPEKIMIKSYRRKRRKKIKKIKINFEGE